MKDFRELKVWEKAHALTLTIYQASRKLPAEERYGLTSQIRRAATSIATNIAEGCGRSGDTEFRRFLGIAFGSASEVEYLLLLCHDLKLIESQTHHQLTSETIEVKRMLSSLIQKLNADR